MNHSNHPFHSPEPDRVGHFHPLSVLIISILAGAGFALLVAWRYDGARRDYLLWYYTPVGVAFVSFVLDRLQRLARTARLQLLLDLVVVLLSIARTLAPVPLISGHALFLTHALLTARPWVTRLVAAAVLLQVAYVKIVMWHDASLIGGLLLGCITALVYRRAAPISSK